MDGARTGLGKCHDRTERVRFANAHAQIGPFVRIRRGPPARVCDSLIYTLLRIADRTTNLLGAHSIAVVDAVRAATERAAGHLAAAPAALVAIDAHPGQSLDALRASVGLTASGVVRLVDRLASDGQLERRPGRDGRSVALHLTRRGRATLRRVQTARSEALEAALTALTDRERAQLERLLEKLVADAASDRPGALRICRLCDRDACCGDRGCPLDHTTESR